MLITGLFGSVAMAESSPHVSTALKIQQGADKAAEASQKKVDRYDDKASEALAEYKQVIRQVESLRTYNNQVQIMVENQEQGLASMHRQIASIEHTNIEVTPLMLKMVASLQAFVRLDLPFQQKERAYRVSRLQELMTNPNVTTSEKYRKILEAYQIESEFGRNIEAYKASLTSANSEGGENEEVHTYNFLRIGRIALMYQSLDGEETGFWNKETSQFESLPDSYRLGVSQGLKIARKQAPPSLIKLPIPAATPATTPADFAKGA